MEFFLLIVLLMLATVAAYWPDGGDPDDAHDDVLADEGDWLWPRKRVRLP